MCVKKAWRARGMDDYIDEITLECTIRAPLAVHGIKFETVTGVCVVLETGLI